MRALLLISGCGNQDGAEVHESTYSALALTQQGFTVTFASLDKPQTRVCNHKTGTMLAEKRNMLVESARIARGAIEDLDTIQVSDYDALVLAGGFGAALNFSDYAIAGVDATVDPVVDRVISAFYAARKPIGAVCIAPMIVAKSLHRKAKITLTVGSSEEAENEIATLRTWGCVHQVCAKGACVIDVENRIISTPAFMYSRSTFNEVFNGINAMVIAMRSLIKKES